MRPRGASVSTGLVARPQSLDAGGPQSPPAPRSGLHIGMLGQRRTAPDFFFGGIGNARWGGARLAPLFEEAGVLDEATEVVFYGADSGTVTIRDNMGIVSGGQTGTVEPDADGGLDLTITEQFARSMSLDEALNRDNLLCYEMNGEPLPLENGFPVRLIAPGWYGVANVKWLTRIEVTDHRYAGNFMARDYVSIREEQRDGQTALDVRHREPRSAQVSAGQSHASGQPVRHRGCRLGRADRGGGGQNRQRTWPQRSSLTPATHKRSRSHAWRFWTFDWGTPAPGEHQVTSRAFDVDGNMQPAPDDPFLASKRTFWEANGHITRRVLIPS